MMNKFKFISTSSPFHTIWMLLRAKVIIDSGTGYFNPFKIIANGSSPEKFSNFIERILS